MGGPRVLIEEWLPVAELGIESRREAAPIPGQFPKLKTLHVWWARRPLAATAGAILASIMPAWSEDLAANSADAPELQTEKDYQEWFLRLCGILGDPVAAKERIAQATAEGKKLGAKAYGYKQAFKNSPTTDDLAKLHRLLESTWGHIPTLLDPTAGGGSIPYEAVRYGLTTTANELNPVAAAILRTCVESPVRFGPEMATELQQWGDIAVARIRDRLEPYFQLPDASDNNSYLFARTVACPRTGKPVPLSPNWWLSKDAKNEVAVRLIIERDGEPLDEIEFEVVSGKNARESNPDKGTVAGGDAVSPWDDLAIDGDYIKAEAQSGRMGIQLYAVAVRVGGKRGFRAPTSTDLESLASAEAELKRRWSEWQAADVIPTEPIDEISNYDRGHRLYGMTTWADFFTPRQLLVHGTFVEEYRRLVPEVRAGVADAEKANAILAVLAMTIAKGVNWNSLGCTWMTGRQQIRSQFEKHNFTFRWTVTEFEGARELYPWALQQICDAYKGIAELLTPSDVDSLQTVSLNHPVPGHVSVNNQNAGDLSELSDRSQTLVCVDPPYGDNVMYAELSDFFYVWEKRTLGLIWPELYESDLTDKKNEAVTNLARFADAGNRKRSLANADYQTKMQSIFAECHRVLIDEGVMTVMFTHKSADAWDALGSSLMEAGFTIEASWPVNTESETSSHQAKKNAAASTIMLACRKRESGTEGAYFEDLEPEVRSEARRALREFGGKGIAGVDLLLSTYGPALSVISSRWPVYSSEADPVTGRSRLLRPEEALDSARAEVTRLQRQRLVGRDQALDPLTDFCLVAWDTFKAVEFPFDEARRLALAVGGLDVDELRQARVLEKKTGTVVMLPPSKRLRREADYEAGLSGVYPEASSFSIALDGLHTAMHIADVDGLAAAKLFLDRTGLISDGRFIAALQGFVNAIPRTKVKGAWVVPEAGILDRICSAYFPEVATPQVESSEPVSAQQTLLDEV